MNVRDRGRHDSFLAHALVRGADLPARARPLYDWMRARLASETWSFCRTLIDRRPTTATFRDWADRERTGLNFASQDYLGLSWHPAVREAVAKAVREIGIHSAGSEINGGTLLLARALEDRLGEFLERPGGVVLFPTGWAAGYAAVRGLARERDHVVLDRLAHNCLQEGARSATQNRHHFAHNDLDSLAGILGEIRKVDTRNAILVVTETLFSMDSDGPDLRRLIDVVHSFGAYLLLDCAHDLCVLGASGRGRMEDAGVLREVDFVVGSFSKALATTGGFLASRWPECLLYVQAFGQSNTFSNAITPTNAAAAVESMRIVASSEGSALRQSVLDVAAQLRGHLQAAGLKIIGTTSALIPVLIGEEQVGRAVCRDLGQRGVLCNFIEFPAVALGASRLRLQVSPAHAQVDLGQVAALIAELTIRSDMRTTGLEDVSAAMEAR